jgi:hypothetical protein
VYFHWSCYEMLCNPPSSPYVHHIIKFLFLVAEASGLCYIQRCYVFDLAVEFSTAKCTDISLIC